MLPDYYSILRIDAAAGETVIKAAYRRRTLECHPDRGGKHEEMVLVNEAWEILGDPERRRRYDAARRETGPRSQSPISRDVAAARARAAVYPARWADFERWLNDVAQDFRAAEWTTTKFDFWKIPVPSKSASANVFVIIGAIICSIAYLDTVMRPKAPIASSTRPPANLYSLGSKPSSPLIPGPVNFRTDSALPQTSPQPLPPALAFPYGLLLFACCGAWLGKWLHVFCVRWLSYQDKKA